MDGFLQYNDGERHVLELGRWNDEWNINHDRWSDDWNSDNRFLATQQSTMVHTYMVCREKWSA